MTWIPLTFWHQDDDLITILGTQFCILQPLMIELRNPTFKMFIFIFFHEFALWATKSERTNPKVHLGK